MQKTWFYYEARRSGWLQISFEHLLFYNWCLQSKYAVFSWILLPSKCDRRDRESNPPRLLELSSTPPYLLSYHGRDSKCNLSASDDTFEERNAVGGISECACHRQGASRRLHVFAARLFTLFLFSQLWKLDDGAHLPSSDVLRGHSFEQGAYKERVNSGWYVCIHI